MKKDELREFNKNKFIKDSESKWGIGSIDYSLMNYVNAKTKVKLRCTKHNIIFEQTPDAHLHNCGCPECRREHSHQIAIDKRKGRNIIEELIERKQYDKIQSAIDGLKYELGGEYTAVKKLNKLQSYLSKDLARYTDIVEIPEAPEGIEYRNMGTQESQIFSKLKKRFCSGRKAFGIHGANALSKVCVLSEKFNIDELERPIPIDTSVEDWIKEIEENVKINKQHRANRKETEENKEIKNVIVNSKFMKEIMKLKEFSEMRCSF